MATERPPIGSPEHIAQIMDRLEKDRSLAISMRMEVEYPEMIRIDGLKVPVIGVSPHLILVAPS